MKKQKFEYQFVYMPSHPKASTNGCVYEHVLAAEQKLGRYLKDGETVHHIDGNKKNNNPDNLIVFATGNDHNAFHAGREIYEKDGLWYAIPQTFVCEICGKPFTRKWTPKGEHIYCSTHCSRIACAKTLKENKPHLLSKDELINLLLNFDGNFLQAAKSLGITDNALRHRCLAYGLPTHSLDYKLCF